ncbi:prepilin-type N-terminal cleavage/methylation domain-containing protein [Marinobacter lacisalsi]|uniref:Prepilin-type N-terminal cleavage/methylation domain-containing protein n=1 Tax=Marinobacter lacisalsi TaxID=475979 RepID=A0ABV8QDH5_9GAMM
MRSHHGATLVELVMTIVIISVAIAGVVGAFSLIAGRSADPLNQTRAVALAQRYMDEILARPFDEAAPAGQRYGGGCRKTVDSSRDRDSYRDVDDFDAITGETPSEYWVSSGGAVDGYEQFSVTVNVDCVADPSAELGASVEAKRVEILIDDPSGNRYVFSAYRVNY